MKIVEVSLLGRFEVITAQEVYLFPKAARLQSLLAYLVLHRDGPKSRRFLRTLLWPDVSDARSAGNLRQTILRLRQQWPAHADYLQITSHHLQWRPDVAVRLDVESLSLHISEGSIGSLQLAIDLYQGDLLPVLDDAWVVPLREEYRQMHMEVLHRLVALYKGQRDYRAAIAHARRGLHFDPLDEEAYHSLIRLYALCRERTLAIQTYRDYKAMMAQEFLATPDPELEELIHRLQQEGTDDTAASALEPTSEAGLFVGQQDAWKGLQRSWDKAREGWASAALLWGQAGIGKSRTAQEFASWLRRQGVTVVHTTCYALEKDLPFAAIASLLRAHPLPPLKPLWRQALRWLLPELDSHDAQATAPSSLEVLSQKQRLVEIIARTCLRWDQPLVLIVDDLQWCDAESLGCLHYLLLRHALRAPVLLVFTLRTHPISRSPGRGPQPPGEAKVPQPQTASWEQVWSNEAKSPALDDLIAACTRAQCLTPLPIVALQPEECSALLRDVDPALSPAQCEQIVTQTHGIPLHLLEAARASVHRWDRPVATPGDETGEQPWQLSALVASHLEDSDVASRWILALIAAMGRDISFELLHQACLVLADALSSGEPSQMHQQQALEGAPPLTRTALLTSISSLLHRSILVEHRTGWVGFSHQLICEQVAAQVAAPHRTLLHRSIALALETLPAEDPVRSAPVLAFHWDAAGDSAQAQGHWYAAAKDACARHAWVEAKAHYQSCLRYDASRLALDARIEMVQEILLPQGEDDAAEQLLDDALAMPDLTLAPDECARIELLQGRILHRKGLVHEAKETFLHALTLLEQSPSPEPFLDALFALASFFSQRGEYAEARDFLHRASALAQESGYSEREGDALQNLAIISVEQSLYQDADRLFEQALQCYHATQVPHAGVRAMNNLAVLYIVRGHYTQGAALCERTLQLRRQLGDRAGEALALTNIAYIQLRQGELETARQLYEEALAIWVSLEHSRGQGYALNNLGAIYRDLGSSSRALLSLQQSLSLARRIGDRRLEGYNHLHRAVLHRYHQQFALAEAHLQDAKALFASLAAPLELASCHCEACFLDLAQGKACDPLSLQSLEAILPQHNILPASELGQAVAQLQGARDAWEKGEALYLGQLCSDLPHAIVVQLDLR